MASNLVVNFKSAPEKMTSVEKDEYYLEASIKYADADIDLKSISPDIKNLMLDLTRNVRIRDVLIRSLGFNTARLDKEFYEINKFFIKTDTEILEQRRSK